MNADAAAAAALILCDRRYRGSPGHDRSGNCDQGHLQEMPSSHGYRPSLGLIAAP